MHVDGGGGVFLPPSLYTGHSSYNAKGFIHVMGSHSGLQL